MGYLDFKLKGSVAMFTVRILQQNRSKDTNPPVPMYFYVFFSIDFIFLGLTSPACCDIMGCVAGDGEAKTAINLVFWLSW